MKTCSKSMKILVIYTGKPSLPCSIDPVTPAAMFECAIQVLFIYFRISQGTLTPFIQVHACAYLLCVLVSTTDARYLVRKRLSTRTAVDYIVSTDWLTPHLGNDVIFCLHFDAYMVLFVLKS